MPINSQIQGVITLVRSALTNEKLSLPDDFNIEDTEDLIHSQKIYSLAYYGAVNCGYTREVPVMQHLFKLCCSDILIGMRQLAAYEELSNKLQEAGVDYLPLKGVLIKNLYPKQEMRSMGDIDILIKLDQYQSIRPIMKSLGYTEGVESDHELHWYHKASLVELHKRLIPSYNKDYYSYFGDGWRLAHPVEEQGRKYCMTAEDNLIYLFTHFAKHYRDAGIGIRHLTDLWIYKQSNLKMDEVYIQHEMAKLQLLDFYRNVCRTLSVWFEDEKPDEITEHITSVIFQSGVYGTRERQIESDALKKRKTVGTTEAVRREKVFRWIFPQRQSMARVYPVLTKHPYLLPAIWVFRWFSVLLFKRENIKEKQQEIAMVTEEQVDNYQDSLHFVGLDFAFGE